MNTMDTDAQFGITRNEYLCELVRGRAQVYNVIQWVVQTHPQN